MKEFVFRIFLVPALLGSVAFLQAEDSTSAKALKEAYEAQVKLANKPVTDFEQRYIEELGKLAKEAQGAGRLEELLAIQTETENFRSGPVDSLSRFPSMVKLREIYDSSLPAMEAKAVEGRSAALQEYVGGISELVAQLTTEGKIDEAVALNELKQRLVTELATIRNAERPGRPVESSGDLTPGETPAFRAEVQTIPGLRGKKGRLRSFGGFTGGEAVIPPEVEDITDFVRVYAFDRCWVGIREDGSAMMRYSRAIRETMNLVEERHVEKISRGQDGWILNRRNEFWRVREPDRVFEAPKTPDGLIGAHCAGLAYRADGRFFTGGSQFDLNRRTPPPEGFFEGVVGACSGSLSMVVVDPGGTLRGWEIDQAQPITFDQISNVVEIECGGGHAVVLKRDNSVETFAIHSGANSWKPSMKVPDDLGGTPARVRAGGETSVIQRTDGTWLAWGPDLAVNDAINSVGIAIDLDVFAKNSGFAIWIEPVE